MTNLTGIEKENTQIREEKQVEKNIPILVSQRREKSTIGFVYSHPKSHLVKIPMLGKIRNLYQNESFSYSAHNNLNLALAPSFFEVEKNRKR